ncbi:hypothetical protein NCS52_00638400 [Fusarium sp. LHS14.1]|nr:hypothetical protein NCS52_00638400 [Fusarium sp. LHS14.1]
MPDNSAAAIANGTSQGLFLHEVDAFVWEKLDKAFVAHDKNPRRVTALTKPWESYSVDDILNAALVTRRVETEMEPPDFASSYLKTDRKIPGLLDILWSERMKPVGLTLQIDLRDEDFAKAIPYFLSIFPSRFSSAEAGYNMHFKSFRALHEAITRSSIEVYRKDYFQINQLHLLPPLIMVFYAEPLIALAEETTPLDPLLDRRSYEHIGHTFMNQVLSFAGVGAKAYNFILEVVHSGLGLGYDVYTGKATNPLNGESLTSPAVIFESRVDRVMINVSLELREKHPQLLFSSCTRLPDVTTPNGKFKANFTTSRLVPSKEGEEGLSTKLRAIHGGLYPQSNLVVADDPAAEIAARTWIDQKSGLDRSQLLRMPYNEWLAGATEDVVAAITKLNDQDLLPSKVGDPLASGTPLGVPDSPIDPGTKVNLWREKLLSPGNELASTGANRYSGHKQSAYEQKGGAAYSHEDTTPGNHHHHVADDSDSVDDLYEKSQSDSEASSVALSGPGVPKTFKFPSIGATKRAGTSASVPDGVRVDNAEELRDLFSKGKGPFGTALATACIMGDHMCVKALLSAEADVTSGGLFCSLLELASMYGYIGIVESLLAVWKKKNGSGDSPEPLSMGSALYEASEKGHGAVVRALLREGADINASIGHWGTALAAACAKGHIACAQLLLDAKADVNREGLFGSPLELASRYHHINIVEKLRAVLEENDRSSDNSESSRSPEPLPASSTPHGVAEKGYDAVVISSSQGTEEPKWRRATREALRAKDQQRRKELQLTNMVSPRPQPKLPSCGCLLCFLDQEIETAVWHSRLPAIVIDPVFQRGTNIRNNATNSSEVHELAL